MAFSADDPSSFPQAPVPSWGFEKTNRWRCRNTEEESSPRIPFFLFQNQNEIDAKFQVTCSYGQTRLFPLPRFVPSRAAMNGWTEGEYVVQIFLYTRQRAVQ